MRDQRDRPVDMALDMKERIEELELEVDDLENRNQSLQRRLNRRYNIEGMTIVSTKHSIDN